MSRIFRGLSRAPKPIDLSNEHSLVRLLWKMIDLHGKLELGISASLNVPFQKQGTIECTAFIDDKSIQIDYGTGILTLNASAPIARLVDLGIIDVDTDGISLNAICNLILTRRGEDTSVKVSIAPPKAHIDRVRSIVQCETAGTSDD